MIVKSQYNNINELQPESTIHIKERDTRLNKYKHLLSNNFIQCFRVDNMHHNGDEIHCINDKGLIYIYNYNSHKFITVLHPRPKQLKRYFQQLNIKIPREIKRLIDENYKRNQMYNLNNI